MIKRRNLNQKPIRLGIWGVSESGKTVYLAKLYRLLQQKGWKLRIDGDHKDFLEKVIEKVENRELPESTDILNDNIKTCEYQIYHDDFLGTNKKVEAVINFFDIGGEFYGGDQRHRIREDLRININGKEITLLDYFLSCDGILFLLDYWRDGGEKRHEKSQVQLLEELFREMDKRWKFLDSNTNNPQQNNSVKLLEPYVAFAVTKADHEDIENSGMSSIELVSKVLNLSDWEDEVIINWFSNYFYIDKSKLARQIEEDSYEEPSKSHRCQFFAISAIGAYYDEISRRWKSGIIIPDESKPDPQEKKTDSQEKKTGDVFSSRSGKSNSPSPSDRFGRKERRNRNRKSKPQIIKGVRLDSINVVEPIEWFIEGILAHSPQLPSIPASVSTNNKKREEETHF